MHDADALEAPSTRQTSVFSKVVIVALFSNNFKMLSFTSYNGKGDPITYVKVFHSWMDFKKVSMLARC